MKTVLITGISGGIATALTQVFIQEGWHVIGTCRSIDSLPKETRANPTIKIYSLNVLDQGSISAFSKELGDTPIDVLINNAGVYDAPSVDSDDMVSDLDKMADVFKVNSIAPRLIADTLTKNLEMGSEKLIVTISSGMGTFEKMTEYHARHWIYSASKAAVNYTMTAYGVTHPDIQVALVHPGWVHTTMGGVNARIEPEESAKGIYELIKDHKIKLPPKCIVAYDGEIINL